MSNDNVSEWRIRNLSTSGPGRSREGVIGHDEPAGEPFYALLADEITQTGWRTRRYIGGYCEACEDEAGAIGETIVDYDTIADPADRTSRATCVRCGHDDATPYYEGSETRSKLLLAVAIAILPPKFAPDYCRKCDESERYGACGRSVRDCPALRARALEAGVPLDVITGARNITKGEADALAPSLPVDADEMHDAGRGRLVRR